MYDNPIFNDPNLIKKIQSRGQEEKNVWKWVGIGGIGLVGILLLANLLKK